MTMTMRDVKLSMRPKGRQLYLMFEKKICIALEDDFYF